MRAQLFGLPFSVDSSFRCIDKIKVNFESLYTFRMVVVPLAVVLLLLRGAAHYFVRKKL